MSASIRAVLFDAVGTLIYPVPDVHHVYAAAGKQFGSRYSLPAIKTRFQDAFRRHAPLAATDEPLERARWRQIVEEIFDDVQDLQLFEVLWHHFAQPAHWALYDDVPETWNWLRQRGLVIGIASNFDARLEVICQQTAPLQDADHLFCSARVGFAKPHPKFYAHVTRTLQLAPAEILMVGDHPCNDVQAARDAGWKARWINRDGGVAGEGMRHLSEITACC